MRWRKGNDTFGIRQHALVDDVRRLQGSPGTTSVLITGESGTGKELIARAIHFGSLRAQGPFFPVNCAAIPSTLAESTLFGHVRGAFTGAESERKGAFVLAHDGTLFLDEMSSMPLEIQGKLLRVLEEQRLLPLGGTREIRINVRILVATNVHLLTAVRQGTFRADLYYRLAGYHITVPPLRARVEDIPLLARHFLIVFATEMGVPPPELSPAAVAALIAYPFPGNIRELKNLIERALIDSGGSTITPHHLRFLDVEEHAMSSTTLPAQPPTTQEAEALVLARAQTEDEAAILAYIRRHGSMTNQQCRGFLGVDHRRATYLLTKLQRYGVLVREGKQRWSRYRFKAQ